MTRSELQRISDIRYAISAIHRSRNLLISLSHADDLEETVLAAIIHQLFVIGEAVKSLSPEFRDSLPEIPWKDIMRQRDYIGHHYFNLESDSNWSTIDKPLSELEAALRGLPTDD